jgi:hypothetical protein
MLIRNRIESRTVTRDQHDAFIDVYSWKFRKQYFLFRSLPPVDFLSDCTLQSNFVRTNRRLPRWSFDIIVIHRLFIYFIDSRYVIVSAYKINLLYFIVENITETWHQVMSDYSKRRIWIKDVFFFFLFVHNLPWIESRSYFSH